MHRAEEKGVDVEPSNGSREATVSSPSFPLQSMAELDARMQWGDWEILPMGWKASAEMKAVVMGLLGCLELSAEGLMSLISTSSCARKRDGQEIDAPRQ